MFDFPVLGSGLGGIDSARALSVHFSGKVFQRADKPIRRADRRNWVSGSCLPRDVFAADDAYDRSPVSCSIATEEGLAHCTSDDGSEAHAPARSSRWLEPRSLITAFHFRRYPSAAVLLLCCPFGRRIHQSDIVVDEQGTWRRIACRSFGASHYVW